jgi:uncharacterized protein (DUF1499 family)
MKENRKRLWKIGMWVLILLVVLGIGGLGALAWRSRSMPPVAGGVQNGTLAPCGNQPNCVSSADSRPEWRVAPIAFEADPAGAVEVIKKTLSEMPNARIVSASEGYLHAEFRTPLFGFTDDVELLYDPEQKVIHIRAASRVGYSDLGVNRKRVEEIRERLAQ